MSFYYVCGVVPLVMFYTRLGPLFTKEKVNNNWWVYGTKDMDWYVPYCISLFFLAKLLHSLFNKWVENLDPPHFTLCYGQKLQNWVRAAARLVARSAPRTTARAALKFYKIIFFFFKFTQILKCLNNILIPENMKQTHQGTSGKYKNYIKIRINDTKYYWAGRVFFFFFFLEALL